MARATLTRRVEVLEQTVSELATLLPERIGAVEHSLEAFRADVRVEFAAVRAEMRDGNEMLRSELRAEMREGQEALRAEMREGNSTLTGTLRAEIRDGDEETRRYMRVLYEDLVDRIRTMSEGIDELRARPMKRPRRE